MFFWPFGDKKNGLVLGGGVARGIAHIGVLKVIKQYQIPIHYIAATSSGAIVGAAFAAGLEVSLIEEIALRISWGRLLRLAFFRPGFISSAAIEELLDKYIGNKSFSELKIPLVVVATDIKTGEAVGLRKGKVSKAVAASAAFPGLFAPEEINHRFLIDGGLADNLPVGVVRRMGAGRTIAVDVVPSQPVQHLPRDPFQAFGRSLDLALHKLSVKQRRAADILIEPLIDEDVWHLDLHKAKRLIAAGESAGHKALRKFRRA
ncbi:esterase [Candidatus Saganbacteria bacterium CG08_land_8_20_14_0_20_45_16]|uniref:Esterase n=1 Tax=Candidatus Saganbacteria bacterium CG08_land_8_20_14_0_20_45_16 TaxID=2014293 RepID=A0A2H0XXH3_UNCSA|nr:MAG: esterase [Candidatus Saganbacteria bacterium CG08_land_8_20_14_0_20_45_16]